MKSRTGTIIQHKQGQHLVAWNIASLWDRSYKINNDLYNAMISMGYTGQYHTPDDFKAEIKDWAWLTGVCIVSGIMLYLNVITGN